MILLMGAGLLPWSPGPVVLALTPRLSTPGVLGTPLLCCLLHGEDRERRMGKVQLLEMRAGED